ncbi:MAG: sulfatase-like hydrolase/transferase, partial [Pirellula sp.]
MPWKLWILSAWVCLLGNLACPYLNVFGQSAERPNILWITCEDTGPQLGCYGDGYATTPNLDLFAERSLRFNRCWSNAPVCAPARTTLITGLYPTSFGAQHMRSMVDLPKGASTLPNMLRQAGYYCSNNNKEDYNFPKPEGMWDDSSNKAHWRNRKAGQPFFSVFNTTVTHEGQIRKRPYKPTHDPKLAPIPPYHPDDPEGRLDWAQYYDRISEMDQFVGDRLQELEDAGLA